MLPYNILQLDLNEQKLENHDDAHFLVSNEQN